MNRVNTVNLQIAPTYLTPALDKSSRIHHVLKSALKARGSQGDSGSLIESGLAYWDAKHFGLQKSSIYKDLSTDQKNALLEDASLGILEEAYFIEKSGMSFTSKMALLSESTEERMLYSLFSADETVHLSEVLSHLPAVPNLNPMPPFVHFLSEIIRDGDRPSLVFLIQVVLEGWGITHYQELAENCKNGGVHASLRLILKDEARHHGSGMILSRGNSYSLAQRNYIRETMIEFLRMVQCGPQALVSTFEKNLGHLNQAQKITLFEELECTRTSFLKIQTLKSLLTQAGEIDLIEYLDKSDVLRPYSAQECAELNKKETV